MPDLFRSALTLSLTSLGVTTLALALFALLIIVLRAGFSTQRREGAGTDRASVPDSPDELAAAIGLAVHLASRSGQPGTDLGAALLRGPGPYWRPDRPADLYRMPQSDTRDD